MARGRMIDKVVILSRKINAVSEGAENLYYRIYANTDDFGIFHADPKILKGQIYTLRSISVPTIEKRLNELINIILVKVFVNNGEEYLEIVDFEKHQTFRKDYTRKHEYPSPGINSYKSVQGSTKSPTKLNKSKLNKNKLSSSCLGKNPNEVDIKLTQLLIDLMQENDPKSSIIKNLTEKRQNEWINQCRLLREEDKRTEEEIETIIRWSQKDNFWKANILSMVKLRKQFSQLWLKANKTNFSGIQDWIRKRREQKLKEEK